MCLQLHLLIYALNLSNDGCRCFPLVFIRGIAIIRGAGIQRECYQAGSAVAKT